jgi:HEAT repeat protein
MAIKARQKRRPQPSGRSVFPRRLSWCDVDAALDYLFRSGVETPEAQRIVLRFKRARSQLLPIFGCMVVSPYERERAMALILLERMGGRTTLQVVEGLLLDQDVYDAFKLDLTRLRDVLAPRVGEAPDEEDDEDGEAAPPRRRRGRRGEEDEGEAEAGAGAEGEGEGEGRRPRPRSRRGRPAPKGRAGDTARPIETTRSDGAIVIDAAAALDAMEAAGTDPPAPSAAEEPERGTRRPQPRRRPLSRDKARELVTKPSEAFLDALDGGLPVLLEVFAELPAEKRVSFVDRLARTPDARAVPFLGDLLRSPERAVVQSVLKTLTAIGSPTAIPALEALIQASPARSVRVRAEQLCTELGARPAAEPAPAAFGYGEESEPRGEEPDAERSGRSRSRRRRGRGGRTGGPETEGVEIESAEPETVDAAPPVDTVGLLLPALAVPTPSEEPLTVGARLPRLHECLVSGVGPDGTQEFRVYRAGEGDTLERLTSVVSESGWHGTRHDHGLSADADAVDRAAAAETGAALLPLTLAYVRARVQHAAAINADLGLALPRDASATLAWLGSSRRVDVAEEMRPDVPRPTQEAVEALLGHPLMALWRVGLATDGSAMHRWLATRGRRTASRQRKLLIDEVIETWLARHHRVQLAEQLRRQALLLRRADAEAEADTALACAAALLDADPLSSLLLREIAYRAFYTGVETRRGERRRPDSDSPAAEMETTQEPEPQPEQESEPQPAMEPEPDPEPQPGPEQEFEQEFDPEPEEQPRDVDHMGSARIPGTRARGLRARGGRRP